MAGSSPFSAEAVYGVMPSPQPTATSTVDHPPGTPEPRVRTEKRPTGPAANPVLILVALVGVAMLLVQLTTRR